MTIKFTRAIILISILCNTAFAQWTKIGYMTLSPGDTVSAGNFVGFGNNMYSCTNKGIFKSTDDGNTWNNVSYNVATIMNQAITCIWVTTNGNIYAGGNARLYKSTDNCATWTWVNTIADSITYVDIIESNGNLVVSYTKGADYGIYYSSNAGASWTAATGISSIAKYFLNDNNVLYVGGTGNGVYKSTDNGATWSIAGTGFPASAGIWKIVKSGTSLFANSISGAGVFVSRDNAATWANTDTSVFKGFCQVFSITAANNKIVATMDGPCNGGNPIKASNDDGNSWSPFMNGLPGGFSPSLGRNASGTALFTKMGNKVFRYSLVTAISDINGAATNRINITPNPSNGTVQLTIPENTKELNIYSTTGILVKSIQTTGQTNMNIQLNTSGIYIVKAAGDKEIRTSKIVVNQE